MTRTMTATELKATLLLDTHVVQWWTAEPDRLSQAATAVTETAGELAVSAVTW